MPIRLTRFSRRSAPRTLAFALALAVAAAAAHGCAAFGLVSSAATTTIDPEYKNLAGQRVGVMVWADNGAMIDQPALTIDTATGIGDKLKSAADGGKFGYLKDIAWVRPEQIVRFQQDHPELEGQPAAVVASKIPSSVTRLIYVEVGDFSTHPSTSVDLFRGHMKGSIKVIEINNGVAKVAYQHDSVDVSYPKNAPPEGMPLDDGEAEIYRATVDAFTTQASLLFVEHPEHTE